MSAFGRLLSFAQTHFSAFSTVRYGESGRWTQLSQSARHSGDLTVHDSPFQIPPA